MIDGFAFQTNILVLNTGAKAVRAGRTMDDVVAAIFWVNDKAGEISSGNRKQSGRVGQVGQAVSQMDQTTQQNTAPDVQSATAAQSLRAHAAALVQAVAVFRQGGYEVPFACVGVTQPCRPALKRPAAGQSPCLSNRFMTSQLFAQDYFGRVAI